jgi:uncharacterized damage-inducible protein DinB
MSHLKITKPLENEYPSYFKNYISKISEDDLITLLEKNGEITVAFFLSVSEDKHNFRYAEGKWSVKEILGHLIDAERIFTYRAMRFSRADQTDLAGFDENTYVPNSNAANRNMTDMIEEYKTVRNSSIAFYKSLSEPMTLLQGTANGRLVSVRALGFFAVGHEIHHTQIITERYLG